MCDDSRDQPPDGAKTDDGLASKAYAHTREAIFTGRFTPGDQLKEQTLAEMFGLSRTPIREALRKLAAEGFVRIIPRIGVFVRRLTLDDMLALLELRRSVESGTAPLAALKATKKGLEELEELAVRLDDADDRRNMQVGYEYELKFHQKIVDLADNLELKRLVSNAQLMYWILGYYERAWFKYAIPPEYPERPIYHIDIVKTLAERDCAKAFKIMWDHISAISLVHVGIELIKE